MNDRPATERELLRWAEALSATAITGLGFTTNLYERERFEEVLEIAADIRSHVVGGLAADRQVQEWLDRVGKGVAGYVTPKITVGAVVGNDVHAIMRAISIRPLCCVGGVRADGSTGTRQA